MIRVLDVTSQPQQDVRQQPVIKHMSTSAAEDMNIHTRRASRVTINSPLGLRSRSAAK